MNVSLLTSLRARLDQGHPLGVTSVCSAHELVIEATLLRARESLGTVLIEATCNQVNQEGGYTGMTPADFRDFVFGIADRVGIDTSKIILGGDHLGPNPWKHLPAAEAMAKASDMIAAYAEAGFGKLHLDASVGCKGESLHLPDETVAERAVMLAQRAEKHAKEPPVYIIGTEIPTPGGATEALDHLTPTTPTAVRRTYEVHARAFAETVPDAWKRVLGIVVQPGVEFGHDDLAIFDPARASALSATLTHFPGLVFEAHSTDYQPENALAALVREGFCILKVGPELTFALREALYGLDAISGFLSPHEPSLRTVMEEVMCDEPAYWRSHYEGTQETQRLLRHFSYSDRIRYYWPNDKAREAVNALIERLSGTSIPLPLISQYLPRLYDRVASGILPPGPRALLIQAVQDVLDRYGRAAGDYHLER